MAIITGHAAVAGTPLRRKNSTDKFGQIHYLLLEPEREKEFKRRQGADCSAVTSGATRYLAERTFYV